MKKLIFSILLSIALTAIVVLSNAQVTAGPSDIITPPPTSTSQVGAVICNSPMISITAVDSGITTYQWYKLNTAGTPILSTVTTANYTEESTTPGYYNYEVVATSGTGCISSVSAIYKVYVLPVLNASITSPVTSVCSVAGNSVLLTANVPTGYSYTYQWTQNGQPINGATGSTYNVTGQTTVGNVTFACNVAYALNPACGATATKVITVVSAPKIPTIQ